MSSRVFLTFNPDLNSISALGNSPKDKENVTEEMERMPLQSEWTVWEQIESSANKDYTNHMKPVMEFDTVQDFWRVWKNLPQPSQLMADHRMVRKAADGDAQFVDAIMIFRDQIKPMWEDPVNAIGGHLEIRYPLAKTKQDRARVDEHWNNLVLGMIGSMIEPAGMITGVRLVDKLHSTRVDFLRIEIWFTELGDPDAKNKLKANIEKIMLTGLNGEVEKASLQWFLKKHTRG